MGFVFQVIEVAAWMFGYFYSTSKIYTTYHDLFAHSDCLLDLLGWLSSEILRLHVQETDDDALLKVDTPVWSYHLISAFGGGGLADTTLDYTLVRIVIFFFLATFSVCTFFPRSCCLFPLT